MDLVLRLQLASAIPLVPIEGRLTGEATGAAIVAAGVPGGAVVQTYELTATVASLDKAARKVTLLLAQTYRTQTESRTETMKTDRKGLLEAALASTIRLVPGTKLNEFGDGDAVVCPDRPLNTNHKTEQKGSDRT